MTTMTAELLARLNSATKYPSIPTYHLLDGKGKLTEHVGVLFDRADGIEVCEKIDGTNTRILFPPDGGQPLIGSRTELLTRLGDTIHNPSQGIVDAVRATAEKLRDSGHLSDDATWTVVYGEVYGGRVGAHAKHYTTDPGATGFRVFDIAHVPVEALEWEPERIAAWRDAGGQDFWDGPDMRDAAGIFGLETVPLLTVEGPPPTTLDGAWTWLRMVSTRSLAALTDDAPAVSEGVVIRTPDRSRIAKLRHEDYRRVLGANRVGR